MKKPSIYLPAVLAILFAITSAFTPVKFDYVPRSIDEIYIPCGLVYPGGAESGSEADVEAEIDAGNLSYLAEGDDLDSEYLPSESFRNHCVELPGSLCTVSVKWDMIGTSMAQVIIINDYELGYFVSEI